MSNPEDLIVKALEYYDNNREQFMRFFNKIRYYRVEVSASDAELDVIFFYDKNKEEILKSRFEFLGSYNSEAKTWQWAWSNPVHNKNRTTISRLILNYGFNISNDPRNQFLKTELITSRFKIHTLAQLDVHIAIGSYISKNILICNLTDYLNINTVDEDNPKQILYKIIPLANDKYISYSLILLDYDKIIL
jgi:hypothetical protein